MIRSLYKKVPFLLFIALAASCTKTTRKSACSTQLCTALFATVNVTFVDGSNAPVTIKDLAVTNQRTNANITGSLNLTEPGQYDIVDDSSIKLLSAGGDNLQVKATSSTTSETKTFTMKVAGGECACHVSKVSGPDTVRFN